MDGGVLPRNTSIFKTSGFHCRTCGKTTALAFPQGLHLDFRVQVWGESWRSESLPVQCVSGSQSKSPQTDLVLQGLIKYIFGLDANNVTDFLNFFCANLCVCFPHPFHYSCWRWMFITNNLILYHVFIWNRWNLDLFNTFTNEHVQSR